MIEITSDGWLTGVEPVLGVPQTPVLPLHHSHHLNQPIIAEIWYCVNPARSLIAVLYYTRAANGAASPYIIRNRMAIAEILTGPTLTHPFEPGTNPYC